MESWRAFRAPWLKDLSAQQSDAEFNAELDQSVQSIYKASNT